MLGLAPVLATMTMAMAGTILVVDDSPTIRRMVKASLAGLGAGFAEAGNGLEAIERLALGSVAVVVLDLNMPDMHGLEVLRFIRTHPSHAALPVVVLTTRGDTTSREAALAAGATDYLTKPFEPAALASRVTTLLSRPAAALRAR